MTHLARHYHVVSIERVLESVLQGTLLPKRAVLITFDDAYSDFDRVAWPILRSLGLPATLFVVTAHASDTKRHFWWDRLYHCVMNCASSGGQTAAGPLRLGSLRQRAETVYRIQALVKSMPHAEGMRLIEEICSQLREPNCAPVSTLGWDELQQLARQGVTLGAHTQTHPILTQLTLEEALAEIAGAQQDLLTHVGAALPIFCYPAGRHNESVARILREQGIVLGFTTNSGQNDLASYDLLRLRRTDITPRTTLPLFWVRLLSIGNNIDGLRYCRQSRETAPVRRRGSCEIP
jgi:peptidoglycan/xylan/chitin deacetylase (PgdA/CDA1 family)